MSTYKKEEFINLLQSYIDKLNIGNITPNEGLLLVEFFTKNHLQTDQSYSDYKEDALTYAFMGYYLKELCKKELNSKTLSELDLTTSVD